jgi:succinyl-CoA synthetase beta subunit
LAICCKTQSNQQTDKVRRKFSVPIVIRLTGTNEEIAMKILSDNGFSASADMDEAVQKAVELASGRGGKAA